MLIAWLSDETQVLVSIITFTGAFLFILLFNEVLTCLNCFQTGASLQQKTDGWKEKVNDTRGSRPRTPTHLDQEAQVIILS